MCLVHLWNRAYSDCVKELWPRQKEINWKRFLHSAGGYSKVPSPTDSSGELQHLRCCKEIGQHLNDKWGQANIQGALETWNFTSLEEPGVADYECPRPASEVR